MAPLRETIMFRIITLILLLFPLTSDAQYIIGVGSEWSDSFRSWIFHTDIEDVKGKLEIRWGFREDFTEWDFRMGERIAEWEAVAPVTR